MTAPSELEPFINLAALKRLPLRFDDEATTDPAPWEMDWDFARTSIANAIVRARASCLREVEIRLERLLREGTAVEHVDFAAAYKSVYYFPDDVEKMARAGPLIAYRRAVYQLAWLRCSPDASGFERCAEITRRICVIGDPVKELS